MKNIIKYLTIFICTLSISINSVLANTDDHIVNFNRYGSIDITLKDNVKEDFIKGAQLTIQLIATASSSNNNLVFQYHDNIKDCQADLSNLKDINLVNEIYACVNNDTELPMQTKLTNDTGNIKFDNLELGLYLITQTNKVKGYSNIDPFLAMIPKQENNKWIYDIKAVPKTDIIRLFDISVEKKWDTIDSESTPESVTIELLKGSEVVDTVILNKENNWAYTWVQIEESDKYSVREINIPAGYTATYRQVENKFIVTNTKTLVQTGTNILLIEALLTLGIIFIVVGVIYEQRKKYE